ncbi:MAG: DEAD/DEAH box helicase [Oceanococcus sp.]
MRYTLKDYQDDAVGDVLCNLADACDDWHRKNRISSFSLAATTGAGKTVMAAAVIEALFDGNPDHNFTADSGAVVLWFTDDPQLNEQTRFKLMDAADNIAHSRLEVIESTFSQDKLQPGKVYFLNRQKLSKNATLVRGADDEADNPQQPLDGMPPPDKRANTMWDILRNTIEDDSLTLYLILDEAHRGMKGQTSNDRNEKSTIVHRLINGGNGAPPVPVVWGISATVKRFKDAMAQVKGRTQLPDIEVDPARVQESGLLKDDIRLDFPAEIGTFDTALLTRGTKILRQSTESWRTYAEQQDDQSCLVLPLMVVQMPNKPSDELLLEVINTVRAEWPELGHDAIAQVFGGGADIAPGGITIPYVRPQMVQDQTHIRLLLAKDAISTGWDCPRAEVFVSFRSAQDVTYITQLLGRMVRTPLARRIPGNDVLNSVSCVLPKFDKNTATNVASAMTGDRRDDADGSGGGDGRRILIEPVDMVANPKIPAAVWAAFDALPSHTLPRKSAKAVSRFTALAQALSRDGLRKGAVNEAYGELCKVLDGLCARYPDELRAALADVQEVSGISRVVGIHGDQIAEDEAFYEAADDRAIQGDYKAACRVLSPELAKRYADYISDPEDDDTLIDAHITVAAIGKMQAQSLASISETLEQESEKLTKIWFDQYRVDIKGLSDERQAAYSTIKGMSPEPQDTQLQRPRIRSENTKDLSGKLLPTRPLHLMADSNGQFPITELNAWELSVLDTEMNRGDLLAWYRNPARASDDALAVAWKDGHDNWRRMCPDFIFFHGNSKDVKVSIVDPHGHHLGDALAKLRALAKFAEEHGHAFHRIDAVAKIDDQLRALDLKDSNTRKHVSGATDAGALYGSENAANY